jgi:hypothetical protein
MLLLILLILGAFTATIDGLDDEFHVIFSTDCTFFQDWQSLLVFHSAVSVGQKGKITRIASGCDESKKSELTQLYLKLFPQYSVHFTPDFSHDKTSKERYEFYNKPFGVEHWLENVDPPIPSGTIVALIDPDFIFLRPLVAQVAGQPNNIFMTKFNMAIEKVPEKVSRGLAVSQRYGLGAPWTMVGNRHFDKFAVCGEHSPCTNVSTEYANKYFRFAI